MAIRKSKNYNLTLQDNDEFVDIETTAGNFEKLDDIVKEIDSKLAKNQEEVENLKTNGYSHPEYTSRASGLYKITVDELGHVSSAIKATKSDITALGIPGVNTVYSHPTYLARSTGLYKIAVDGTGHVSTVSAVSKSDITALGVPGENTTYSNATTSKAGLMSAADKIRVNKIDTLEEDVDSLKSGGSAGEVLFEGKMGQSDWPETCGDPTTNTIKNISKYKIVLATIDDTDVIGTITKVSNDYSIVASTELIIGSASSEDVAHLFSAMVIADANGKVKTAFSKRRETKSSSISTKPVDLTKIVGII